MVTLPLATPLRPSSHLPKYACRTEAHFLLFLLITPTYPPRHPLSFTEPYPMQLQCHPSLFLLITLNLPSLPSCHL